MVLIALNAGGRACHQTARKGIGGYDHHVPACSGAPSGKTKSLSKKVDRLPRGTSYLFYDPTPGETR